MGKRKRKRKKERLFRKVYGFSEAEDSDDNAADPTVENATNRGTGVYPQPTRVNGRLVWRG